ncbi:hypothetical protein Tco_1546512 [Tanacetum coccineum]
MEMIVTTSRYVVPTGRVKVPAGRYVVPTGKDNVIVSAGRTKVIPAGRTILVLIGQSKNYIASVLFLRIICDFHHLDDARDIWLAVKARFGGSESEGLHKGLDRFRDINHSIRCKLKHDNDDMYKEVSQCIPPSWSQGAHSYESRGHFCSLPIQLYYLAASRNVIENVLHSFVAKSDPQQQITFEDFDQIEKLDLEELDIKWKMAMLSVRINRFEKKARIKMKFNNKDAARFDKKKTYEGEMWKMVLGSSIWMIAGAEDDAAWCLIFCPSIFDSSLKDVAEKPLYDRFVKVVGMHAVPPPITGTFMPPSNEPELDDT